MRIGKENLYFISFYLVKTYLNIELCGGSIESVSLFRFCTVNTYELKLPPKYSVR